MLNPLITALKIHAIACLLCMLCIPVMASATTYYVDAVAGSDAFNGVTPATAWKTLAKVNAQTFLPGDTILLKRGSAWTESLVPKGSGALGSPIVLGTYGTGAQPAIHTGGTATAAIRLSNQQYWEIENLEVTNLHPTNGTTARYGIYVTGTNIGAVRHLFLRNLTIHSVNGDPTVKTCGGIFFEITGTTTPSWFDSVVVEGCDIYDISPVGVANASTWDTRTLTTNTDWTPSVNMIMRNNSIRRSARNGMIIRVSKRALIEHNVFQECAITESGNAVFTFNCDSTIMQYNEAYLTRFNTGDADAGGFDGDYRCKSTIIQYNYAHDNEYGGVVVVSDGAGATTFNDGTIVRYNVLKDNLNHVLRTSGNVTNTTFSNNTIYSGSSLSPVKVVWHKSWGGYSATTRYYNNIVELLTPGSSYDLGSSTNNLFDYNLFHGIHPASEPSDAHKSTADPMFAAPDSAGTGWATAAGLRLTGSSPAINSGMTLVGHSTGDYLGATVPYGSVVDRGAFEYQEPPLPIQLQQFTGASRGPGSVLLEWRTLTETNNYGFKVERRGDNRTEFSTVPGSFVGGHRTTLQPHDYSFEDTTVAGGVFWYRLKQIDLDGSMHFTDPLRVRVQDGGANAKPGEFGLRQAFPNPFNPSTTISFWLDRSQLVTVRIRDTLGRDVATLLSDAMDAGEHSVRWDARGNGSGMYFCEVGTAEYRQTLRLMLLK